MGLTVSVTAQSFSCDRGSARQTRHVSGYGTQQYFTDSYFVGSSDTSKCNTMSSKLNSMEQAIDALPAAASTYTKAEVDALIAEKVQPLEAELNDIKALFVEFQRSVEQKLNSSKLEQQNATSVVDVKLEQQNTTFLAALSGI
eukprot:gene31954-24644_t